MNSLGLPPGFRFDPTDKELVNLYLKPKVLRKDLPCDIIEEKQIYGTNSNPWDVFDDLSTDWMIWDNLKTVYVFTSLTKIAAVSSGRRGKKENYMKTAGYGTWHGETSRKPIMEDDRVIGFTRLLVYQINDVDSCLRNEVDLNKIGHWLMHEYVLSGYEDYALCRITVDMSKTTKLKPKTASANKKITAIKSKPNKKTTSRVSKASQETASNHDVGGFVEEKECQRIGQALTPEQAAEFLMNDSSEDFDNFGLELEELLSFDGNKDGTSFDLESFFTDGSWSDVTQLVDKVPNSNNVQTTQNMSCSKALGKSSRKRKAFEAQGLSSMSLMKDSWGLLKALIVPGAINWIGDAVLCT